GGAPAALTGALCSRLPQPLGDRGARTGPVRRHPGRAAAGDPPRAAGQLDNPDTGVDAFRGNRYKGIAASLFLEDSMEGIGWLGAIIVGGIAGALAGRFVSGHGYGIILDVIVGIIGGVVGGWLVTTLFRISGSRYVFSFIVSFIGGVSRTFLRG